MFMESDHGGKTSLTNSSSFAPRTLSSFLWTFINNTKTSRPSLSSSSLFDPLCYTIVTIPSNHQNTLYVFSTKIFSINFPSLQNKLLWELNILEYLDARSYQLTLCITYYISKHRCACFLCCFGIIFSPLIVHEYKKNCVCKKCDFFLNTILIIFRWCNNL